MTRCCDGFMVRLRDGSGQVIAAFRGVVADDGPGRQVRPAEEALQVTPLT
jgi:hypothetical protein